MHKILIQAVGPPNDKQKTRAYSNPRKMTATEAAMLAAQPRRPTSAAINRQRELQRIDAENMVCFKDTSLNEIKLLATYNILYSNMYYIVICII